MKIIIPMNSDGSKVILENGQDITKELMLTKIEIIAEVGEFTRAILTVIPKMIEAEIAEGLFKDQLIKLKAISDPGAPPPYRIEPEEAP